MSGGADPSLDPSEEPVPIAPKPEGCQLCPAFDTGKGFVPGRGPLTAKLALIGQGPGKVEAYNSTPFKGPSGKLLTRWLQRSGVPEDEVYIDNAVRCWLPKDRKPLAKEIRFCWEVHLRPVLAAMPNLKVVVPVGVPAQTMFLSSRPNEKAVGTTNLTTKEIFDAPAAEEA